MLTMFDRKSTSIYIITDIAIILICCALAFWLRFDSLVIDSAYQLPLFFFLTFSILSLSANSFYEAKGARSSKIFARSLSGIVASAFLTAGCLFLTKTGADYSRLWLSYSVLLSILGLYLYRVFLREFLASSIGKTNLLLVGGGDYARRIKNHFDSGSEPWISLVNDFCLPTQYSNKEVSSSIGKLMLFLEKRRSAQEAISEIWITHDYFSQATPEELTQIQSSTAANIVFVPQLPPHLGDQRFSLGMVDGFPAVQSRLAESKKTDALLKMAEDKVFAILAIILLSPMLCLIALSIKLGSPGPILYRQFRYGLDGNEFTILKFRSMYITDEDDSFRQAKAEDPRITKLGKILRRTSLDELPQLFNVISGDMSIVGPRPHPTSLNEQYRDILSEYMQRHKIKPGITGLAQINGYRGETSTKDAMARRIEFDLTYIQNWSLLLDLKIIASTVLHVFTTDRAY